MLHVAMDEHQAALDLFDKNIVKPATRSMQKVNFCIVPAYTYVRIT